MASVTFDGPNKIIDIGYDGSTTTVRAATIYSEWKRWVRNDEGAWYDEAFAESVGGNPLGGGANLDGYYFLRNDLGWRIRAADQDHTLVVDGQLFGFFVGTAIALSRPGRTITYQYTLSSRSQVINPAADTVTASGSFNGRVWCDPTSAYAGTDFPNGTSVQPVNNMVDAVAIAGLYGLKEINVLDNLTLTEDVRGYRVVGADTGVLITVAEAALVQDTTFEGLDVTGYFDGNARIRKGRIDTIIEGFTGQVYQCSITTGIVCNGDVSILSSSSGQPWQGGAYLDYDGGAHGCQVREWTGTIEIRNLTAGATLSVDLIAGRVIIAASCTGGSVKVRGVGEPIEDNSGGAVTIDRDGFLSATGIESAGAAHTWAAAD